MLIAETILPISLNRTFDYIIPQELQDDLKVGMRVIVSFGKKPFTTALVYKIKRTDDENPSLKTIISLLDTTPIFTPQQIRLWETISNYYQCSLGEIFKNESPSYLKVESETSITLNPDIDNEWVKLTKNETAIFNILSDNNPHTIKEISSSIGIKSITRAINSLVSKNIITLDENVKHKYKAKYETHISLSPHLTSEQSINDTLQSLKRAKKQIEALELFLSLIMETTNDIQFPINTTIKKSELTEITTSAIVSELIKKNILVEHRIQIDRTQCTTHPQLTNISTLTPAQSQAEEEIQKAFQSNKCALLHGVAYSGKTEIYAHLIAKTISEGKQALLLVPENALVTQLASRLSPVFGNKLATFHNKLSQNEQTELWNNLTNGQKQQIIIGTKSSIFLPFNNIGLIIVDEEHDPKYKQSDFNPRYHSRNAALFLAHISKCNILLGSATPSIESYTNALNKKFELVNLNERYNNTPLPPISLIDLQLAYKQNSIKGHYSLQLINAINETLESKQQIILLQNRRGYASFIECKHCGFIPKCPNCNVSLSVHRRTSALKCHYCNHTISMTNICSHCGSDNLSYKGFGTEQVETEALELFPNARIARMDIDTMRRKHSYETLISEFNAHNIDILIGTQMVSKGLDFQNVALVGILNADNMLHFPDFRAHEYAYQLITQTVGRCGRGAKNARAIIQTSNTLHPTFKHILSGNYFNFFAEQMREREAFRYPPYFRLIKITCRHTVEQTNTSAANILANALRESFGDRILGPDSPLVERQNNFYIKNIIIKLELDANIPRAKAIINDICDQIHKVKDYSSVRFITDIDPI